MFRGDIIPKNKTWYIERKKKIYDHVHSTKPNYKIYSLSLCSHSPRCIWPVFPSSLWKELGIDILLIFWSVNSSPRWFPSKSESSCMRRCRRWIIDLRDRRNENLFWKNAPASNLDKVAAHFMGQIIRPLAFVGQPVTLAPDVKRIWERQN